MRARHDGHLWTNNVATCNLESRAPLLWQFSNNFDFQYVFYEMVCGQQPEGLNCSFRFPFSRGMDCPSVGTLFPKNEIKGEKKES